jgi:hypothetical protein
MPCALTSNYLIDCKDSLGGLTEVYFMELGNLTSYTEASGVITALVKAAGKKFYKYELVRGTSMFVENINASIENGSVFYQQELTIILNKLQVATRNEILLLAKNRLVSVAKDNNGKYWILGITKGVDISAGTAGSGAAEGDRSGYTLTFTGKEAALSQEVGNAIAIALQTPGV